MGMGFRDVHTWRAISSDERMSDMAYLPEKRTEFRFLRFKALGCRV